MPGPAGSGGPTRYRPASHNVNLYETLPLLNWRGGRVAAGACRRRAARPVSVCWSWFMDLATTMGLVAGAVVVATMILMGGDLGMFVSEHAVIIIFGGSFAATLI